MCGSRPPLLSGVLQPAGTEATRCMKSARRWPFPPADRVAHPTEAAASACSGHMLSACIWKGQMCPVPVVN